MSVDDAGQAKKKDQASLTERICPNSPSVFCLQTVLGVRALCLADDDDQGADGAEAYRMQYRTLRLPLLVRRSRASQACLAAQDGDT
jgi:hypothetical protein